MAIKAKGKGKSGGARVITFNVFTDVENGHVVFLLLYDKEDASTVKVNVVKQLVREMGFDIELIYNKTVGICQSLTVSCGISVYQIIFLFFYPIVMLYL